MAGSKRKGEALDSGASKTAKVRIRAPSKAPAQASRDGPSGSRKSGRQLGEEDYEEEDEDNCELDLPDAPLAQEGDVTGGLDFTSMELKPDHENRPLWVCPNGRIFLETFAPLYKQAYDFLIAIAEPVCRPEIMHEYNLTPFSLYAAVSVGLETTTILSVLERLSKTRLPQDIHYFVKESTLNYGKVKLVLQKNRFMVESPNPAVLRHLLADPTIQSARVRAAAALPGVAVGALPAAEGDGFVVSNAPREMAAAALGRVEQYEGPGEPAEEGAEGRGAGGGGAAEEAGGGALESAGGEDPDKELHSFEIDPAQVEHVKQRCLPGGLNYPMLEEYDFKNDTVNPDLNIVLKPSARLRPYQEKGLTKMFGNGRARSGIIVLPCGAGKSLTAVAAASRVKKSAIVLCTNSVSVDQWKYQFRLWTNLQDHQIARFTSAEKEMFKGLAGVMVTTYTMVVYSGSRSAESQKCMEQIMNREWGLVILDEVHVVPAAMCRKVIGIIKSHCKLGLTATLVREDNLISDLNFLIGPKLYEANWGDLSRAGHIANVHCMEVWCPMTAEFYREYLKKDNFQKKQALYVMNPNKFQATQFLMEYHERQRGDKILIFSDNILALKEYAERLHRPYICGSVSHNERTRILQMFKTTTELNTLLISRVGDVAIDLPEANVLIQISSHCGARRQEAQRLGRILRAKKSNQNAATFDPNEYNAFFYSLVSKDTTEMYFSTKRQQFLIDQGYSFKVVTNLLENAEVGQLGFSAKAEQLNLLARVLAAGQEDEDIAEDADDLGYTRAAPSAAARRVPSSMQALTGAQGMVYMEYSTVAQKQPRPSGNANRPNRHKLFRERYR